MYESVANVGGCVQVISGGVCCRIFLVAAFGGF